MAYQSRIRHAIRYNSVGLFLTDATACSPVTTNIYYFNRVQSANFSVDIPRQDIQQIGSEDFLDRKIVSEAAIKLDFNYLLTDGHEEMRLGFNIASSGEAMPNGTIYADLKEDKSAFIVVGEEPFDLTGYANRPHGYSGTDAIGIGNCFITNYSIRASVGSMAEASVSMAASNIRYSCVGSGVGGHSWLDSVTDLGYLLLQTNPFVLLQTEGLIVMQGPDELLYKGGLPFPSMCIEDGGTEAGSDRKPLTWEEWEDAPVYKISAEDATDTSKILITDVDAFELVVDQEGEGKYVTKTVQHPGTGFEFNPIIYNSPVTAISPGGINVYVDNINVGGPLISGNDIGSCTQGSANLQSFDIALPFAREDLRGFGSMHVYGRKMNYPQMGTLSLSFLSSSFKSGNFNEIFCDDEIYNIEIDLNNQCDFSCAPSSEHPGLMKFVINNAKLQGYSFSESIGSIATVDCSFSFGMSRKNGFFLSGSYPPP